MSKTLALTFSGGFHNSPALTVRSQILGDTAYLSHRQVRSLWQHFCGITSCACGGVGRAACDQPAGWRVYRPRNAEGVAVVVAERVS